MHASFSAAESGNNIHNLYAQDPVFNALDEELLLFLGIKVVKDPEAFSLIDTDTFLYCPGAEKSHLVQVLSFGPALFFGSSLEGRLLDTIHPRCAQVSCGDR